VAIDAPRRLEKAKFYPVKFIPVFVGIGLVVASLLLGAALVIAVLPFASPFTLVSGAG